MKRNRAPRKIKVKTLKSRQWASFRQYLSRNTVAMYNNQTAIQKQFRGACQSEGPKSQKKSIAKWIDFHNEHNRIEA